MGLPSDLRLIKNALEYREQSEISIIPKGVRGIYVLYKQKGPKKATSHHYDFVYIGMATRSIKARVSAHKRHKSKLWSHFSFFEVWDNVQDSEIAELEGLFRHLYRYDSKANALNSQRGYRELNNLRRRTERDWGAT